MITSAEMAENGLLIRRFRVKSLEAHSLARSVAGTWDELSVTKAHPVRQADGTRIAGRDPRCGRAVPNPSTLQKRPSVRDEPGSRMLDPDSGSSLQGVFATSGVSQNPQSCR